MQLRRLYKIWAIAVLVSVVVSGIYVYIATKIYLAKLTPGEDRGFAALPYLLYAHIVGVICTGLLTALLLALRDGFTATNKKLALWLILTHLVCGLAVFALIHYGSWTFFFNPLAFVLFALMPYFSWSIVNRRTNLAMISAALVMLALLVVWQVSLWLVLHRG